MDRSTFRRLYFFYLVAVGNTVVGISSLIFFDFAFGEDLSLANIYASNLTVWFFGYTFNRLLTWRQPLGFNLVQFGIYIVGNVPSLAVQMVAYVTFHHLMGYDYVFVQILSSIVGSILVFVFHEKFTFRIGRSIK